MLKLEGHSKYQLFLDDGFDAFAFHHTNSFAAPSIRLFLLIFQALLEMLLATTAAGTIAKLWKYYLRRPNSGSILSTLE
jgi:hypothetical protein